jgi:hypothetical protein
MILGGGDGSSSLGGDAARYFGLFNDDDSNTEAAVQAAMPVAGTLSRVDFRVTTAPGTGNSFVFVVRVNGTDPNPDLGCTISGTATSCSDTVNSEAFALGDLFSIQVTGTSNPANSSMHWTARYTP